MLETQVYPGDVLTKSKKGKVELRRLLDKGVYFRYDYIDMKTGEKSENKVKLVLISSGKIEEYFIIPLKNGRNLMSPTESKGDRKVWDGEKSIEIKSSMGGLE